MPSFKEIRELLLFSVENNTINEEEFSYSPKDLNTKFATAAASPFTALLQRFLKPFCSAATALLVSWGKIVNNASL